MERDPFDLVGDVLDGQYRVDAVGGLGELRVVYRARPLASEVELAIDCLRLPATLEGDRVRALVEAFHQGARLHHRLSRGSPHLAQSTAIGSWLAKTGMIVPYLVREWLEGESLAVDLRRRRGEGRQGRSVEEAIALLGPAFEALVEAQAQGEVHLALDPRTLFLAQKDGVVSLRVLDFGVARAMTALRPMEPAYAAPEQLDPTLGAVGPWTDVYSLAIVLIELLADQPVVPDREAALDEIHRPTPRSLGLSIPRELEAALSRAVARSPEGRPSRVAELWGQVRAAMQRPAAVAGAVPSRRLVVPSSPSIGTIPMGFEPVLPGERTYVPSMDQAPQVDLDLPPVHVLTTPLPPRVETPALPPVIVLVDTPAASPADPLPPMRAAPSPTFPVISEGRQRSRRTWMLVASAIVGLAAGGGLVALSLHHRPASASMTALGATPASAQAPASASAPVSALASASALALAPASALASASALAPASASGSASDVHPLERFPSGTARLALDGVSAEVTKCRRGKVWGIATATVTFGNDGTVSHVAISVPFTGTPTGACVSDAMSAVHVPPYGGKPGVVAYRFYVAPR